MLKEILLPLLNSIIFRGEAGTAAVARIHQDRLRLRLRALRKDLNKIRDELPQFRVVSGLTLERRQVRRK